MAVYSEKQLEHTDTQCGCNADINGNMLNLFIQ